MTSLSILIPVFNTEVTPLVNRLLTEIKKQSLPVEIILLDDYSDNSFQQQYLPLTNEPVVSIIKNESNLGRAVSRFKLASAARADFLLFIDADSLPVKENFISNYLNKLSKEKIVITGGRIYQAEKPQQCQLILHWLYGSKRESKSGAAFQSNNFLISKELVMLLKDKPAFSTYGHEDTYWGICLEEENIPVKKTDNPVLHNQIEITEKFLQKTTEALANLYWLEQNTNPVILAKHVKLFRWYKTIRSMGLNKLIDWTERVFSKSIKTNLYSCNPSLRKFDFYRLAEYIRLHQ